MEKSAIKEKCGSRVKTSELKNYIKEQITDTLSTEACGKKHSVKEVVSQEIKMQWIKVEDELPQEGDFILVMVDIHGVQMIDAWGKEEESKIEEYGMTHWTPITFPDDMNEATEDEVKNQRELNKALITTKELTDKIKDDGIINEATLQYGKTVKIPSDLTTDPLNRQGEEGKIIYFGSKGDVVIEFPDGVIGVYQNSVWDIGGEELNEAEDQTQNHHFMKGWRDGETAAKKANPPEGPSKEFDSYYKGYINGLEDYLGTQGWVSFTPRGPQPNEDGDLNEMAKITGDLETAINSVITSNKDLEMLPLKKAILADPAVKTALGDTKLYDNQLAKFIQAAKGERTIGKRGPKVDPNAPKKSKKSALRNPTKPKEKKSFTSKLGGRKYYTDRDDKEDGEGPTDNELRKLAKSGGGKIEKSKINLLQQQERTKLIKAFLQDMKDQGIVDNANRISDRTQYDAAWSKAKTDIANQVKNIK